MKLQHILLALVVVFVWGLNFIAIRIGLDAFPPLLMVALRFALAAIPALFLPRPDVPWRRLALISTFLFIGQFSFLFLGMNAGMPPGLASVVPQSQAFITILIAAVMLGEKPSRRQIIGMVVALAGLGVIAETAGGGGVTIAGLLLTLMGALCWACGNVMLRSVGKPDMVAMIAWLSLFPPLPMLALSFIFEGQAAIIHALTHADWHGWLALLYITVLATTVGYGIWSWLMTRYPVATVAPFSLLVPVLGASSAAVLFGEQFGPLRLTGMALVLVGLVIVVLPLERMLRGRKI